MDFQTFQSSRFSSERLSYSLYQHSDLDEVHGLLSLPETDRYNTLGVMDTLNDTKTSMSGTLEGHLLDSIFNFVVVFRLKGNGQFVGIAGLNLHRAVYRAGEIWYKLMPELWGKGFATEVVKWQLDFAFNRLKLHRISAGCAVGNTASYIVMEKVGMRKEGLSKKVLPLEGGWSDTYEYAILAEEYFANKSNQ